ncbi:hypothetical protein PAPYR_7833 [Paratrimastix pyriformis]|uniref:Uncharacterized protein n=1 Tax=Paratrimastix pyriformis TaxID=342808 RepID=A0ABQ8UBZ2_9EUKA|nr:hypothetical protein PAPYR_7833 [Paratrimastix pyriformis]
MPAAFSWKCTLAILAFLFLPIFGAVDECNSVSSFDTLTGSVIFQTDPTAEIQQNCWLISRPHSNSGLYLRFVNPLLGQGTILTVYNGASTNDARVARFTASSASNVPVSTTSDTLLVHLSSSNEIALPNARFEMIWGYAPLNNISATATTFAAPASIRARVPFEVRVSAKNDAGVEIPCAAETAGTVFALLWSGQAVPTAWRCAGAQFVGEAVLGYNTKTIRLLVNGYDLKTKAAMAAANTETLAVINPDMVYILSPFLLEAGKNAPMTITAYDMDGNPVVCPTESDPGVYFVAYANGTAVTDWTCTASWGASTFTANWRTLTAAGVYMATIAVRDGGVALPNSPQFFTVYPGPLSGVKSTFSAPSLATIGRPFVVTTVGRDQYNNHWDCRRWDPLFHPAGYTQFSARLGLLVTMLFDADPWAAVGACTQDGSFTTMITSTAPSGVYTLKPSVVTTYSSQSYVEPTPMGTVTLHLLPSSSTSDVATVNLTRPSRSFTAPPTAVLGQPYTIEMLAVDDNGTMLACQPDTARFAPFSIYWDHNPPALTWGCAAGGLTFTATWTPTRTGSIALDVSSPYELPGSPASVTVLPAVPDPVASLSSVSTQATIGVSDPVVITVTAVDATGRPIACLASPSTLMDSLHATWDGTVVAVSWACAPDGIGFAGTVTHPAVAGSYAVGVTMGSTTLHGSPLQVVVAAGGASGPSGSLSGMEATARVVVGQPVTVLIGAVDYSGVLLPCSANPAYASTAVFSILWDGITVPAAGITWSCAHGGMVYAASWTPAASTVVGPHTVTVTSSTFPLVGSPASVAIVNPDTPAVAPVVVCNTTAAPGPSAANSLFTAPASARAGQPVTVHVTVATTAAGLLTCSASAAALTPLLALTWDGAPSALVDLRQRRLLFAASWTPPAAVGSHSLAVAFNGTALPGSPAPLAITAVPAVVTATVSSATPGRLTVRVAPASGANTASVPFAATLSDGLATRTLQAAGSLTLVEDSDCSFAEGCLPTGLYSVVVAVDAAAYTMAAGAATRFEGVRVPASADAAKSSFTAPATATAGLPFTVTIHALDASNGAVVCTAHNARLVFGLEYGGAPWSALWGCTAEGDFTATVLSTAGAGSFALSPSLVASGAPLAGAPATVAVSSLPTALASSTAPQAASSGFTVASSATVGEPVTVQLTAVDAKGSVVTCSPAAAASSPFTVLWDGAAPADLKWACAGGGLLFAASWTPAGVVGNHTLQVALGSSLLGGSAVTVALVAVEEAVYCTSDAQCQQFGDAGAKCARQSNALLAGQTMWACQCSASASGGGASGPCLVKATSEWGAYAVGPLAALFVGVLVLVIVLMVVRRRQPGPEKRVAPLSSNDALAMMNALADAAKAEAAAGQPPTPTPSYTPPPPAGPMHVLTPPTPVSNDPPVWEGSAGSGSNYSPNTPKMGGTPPTPVPTPPLPPATPLVYAAPAPVLRAPPGARATPPPHAPPQSASLSAALLGVGDPSPTPTPTAQLDLSEPMGGRGAPPLGMSMGMSMPPGLLEMADPAPLDLSSLLSLRGSVPVPVPAPARSASFAKEA